MQGKSLEGVRLSFEHGGVAVQQNRLQSLVEVVVALAGFEEREEQEDHAYTRKEQHHVFPFTCRPQGVSVEHDNPAYEIGYSC